jgi:hypothetical protein
MVDGVFLHRLDRVLVVSASLLGTLPMAVLASACVARFLPFSPEARLAFGLALAVPFWVAAMCSVFLARSAARAWGLCVSGSVLLAAIAYGLPW